MLDKPVSSPFQSPLDIKSRSSTPEEKLKSLSEELDKLSRDVNQEEKATNILKISS